MVALQKQLGQFCRSRRLTGTLQTRHHDYGRRTVALGQLGLAATHELGQFLVDDVDDYHTWRKALHDLAAHGFLFHLTDKFLDHFKVDIRFQ